MHISSPVSYPLCGALVRLMLAGSLVAGLAGCGNSAASVSPGDAVTNSADALNGVSGYHVRLTAGQAPRQTVFDLDVHVSGSAKGTVTLGDTKGDIVFAGRTAYLHGKDLVALLLAPQVAATVGTSWVKLPPETDEQGSFAYLTTPHAIGACMTGQHGTLTRGATVTIAGQQAVSITDSGDTSFSAPTRFAIATSGDPLPLELTQTGAPRDAQAKPTACHPGQGTSILFSHFNEAVSVTTPKNALDLTKLAPSAQG